MYTRGKRIDEENKESAFAMHNFLHVSLGVSDRLSHLPFFLLNCFKAKEKLWRGHFFWRMYTVLKGIEH